MIKIGEGGFGQVFHCIHKLDERPYAIKKILLPKNNPIETTRILREVKHLSSLNHQNIVRYYQTWVEKETDEAIIDTF